MVCNLTGASETVFRNVPAKLPNFAIKRASGGGGELYAWLQVFSFIALRESG
jgi:hypothetical protein